ncbi:MAG: TonB-dependent receptor [Cyclobacterium sp.]|uniref:SusC/RagA family TonB-linked outer membrane protein n=1 Tax=Cyclobacterium sp. TaxID=1966343 RepID=UPI0039706DFD
MFKSKEYLRFWMLPLFFLFICSGPSYSQSRPQPQSKSAVEMRKIAGVVVDAETLDPLPGVNILIKGRSAGTVTDLDGSFDLSVQEEDKSLIFSFVGYETQEVPINTVSNMRVELAPISEALSEVIVVGYGTKKRSNLTGAVDDINFQREIGERPVAGMAEMLQGVIPNLNVSTNNNGGEPGAGRSLNIRGVGSLTGNGGEPFILLDGLPITSDQLLSINPSDIDNISVLKDAASAAIYGARGAYGVILITTRKGNSDLGIQVDVSSSIAYASPTVIPQSVNSLEFAKAYNQSNVNVGAQPFFTEAELTDIQDYQSGLKDGETEPNAAGTAWRSGPDGYSNNDWFDIMYRDAAPRRQHRMAISGSFDTKNTYYLSGSFFEQLGNLNFGNEKYNRLNYTANITSQATSWMQVDLSVKYAHENRLFPTGGFGGYDKNIIYHQISRLWPTNPAYAPDGRVVSSDILRIQKSGDTRDKTNNTILQIGTTLEPIKNWQTRISYNYNLTGSNTESIRLVNPLEYPDGTTVNVGYNPDQVSRRFGERTNQLFNITTAYSLNEGGHNLSGMLGYEQRLQESTTLTGNRSQFITPTLPTVSTAVGEERVFDNLTHFSTQGVFGRLSYNYQEKYLFEINARQDGSSFFREGLRWGFFPSASAGYNIARENFWGSLSNTVSNLKLRASWGQLGNHDPSLANLFLELMPATTSTWLLDGGRPVIIRPPGLVSPNLTWETVTSINFGLDAALFENQLEISFDWYNRTTSDMIGPAEALPKLLGSNAPRENNAELTTQGFELALNWRGTIGRVNYRIGANLADNTTTVKKYNNPTSVLSTYREDMEIGEIWGLETMGFFNSDNAAAESADQTFLFARWGAGDIQYRDLNGDGVINFGNQTSEDPGDLRIIGNSTPRYSYGLNLGANWKGFDLSVLVQGVAKRDIMFSGSTNLFWGFVGNMWQSTIAEPHLDYWSETNTNAYFPKPYMSGEHGKNTRSQTRYLQNGAYVRLKNVQLAYTLPANFTQKVHLRNVQFFLSGDNLLTVTNLFETFDPEGVSGAWGGGKVYPLQRVYSAGINLGL